MIKKYFRYKKYILLFVVVLFIFGLLIGLYLGISNIESLKEDVIYYVSNINSISYNYFLLHFFFLTIGFALSFVGIGIPLLCSLIFYEGLTFGFLIGIFTLSYNLGGCIFAFIFFIITKLIFLLILIIFFLKCLEISRKLIGKFIYKTTPNITKLIKSCVLLIILSLINDGLVIFLGKKLVLLFQFLL